LFCGGDASEPNHLRHCDGKQGGRDEPPPPFTVAGEGPDHDGETYDRAADHVRLNAQTLRVFRAMRGGQWLTLRELSNVTGDPEASVSARLRDLRKLKFGAYAIERRRVLRGRGLFLYRMVL
jgi:hypothetical protein